MEATKVDTAAAEIVCAPDWDKHRPGARLTDEQWAESCQRIINRDVEWLIEHWIWIVPEEGDKVLLKLNDLQQQIVRDNHPRKVIPKARKRGVTTIKIAEMMILCIITKNYVCGLAMQTKDLGTKKVVLDVRQMYRDLPEQVRESVKLPKDEKSMLIFSNGATLLIGDVTGFTLRNFHVSEFPKMCAESPDEAEKLIEGPLQSVSSHATVTVEGTSYGDVGPFKQYCMDARDRELKGEPPNRLQYKLFFAPWWEEKKYALHAPETVIPLWLTEYFTRLDKDHGIALTPDQQTWYDSKYKEFDSTGQPGSGWTRMKRQFPSYLEECFESVSEGAIYATQFAWLYKNNRIGNFPFDPSYRVSVAWDLGLSKTDAMALWFFQTIQRRVVLIDYFEEAGVGQGWDYYAKLLEQKSINDGYVYYQHLAPHDILRNEYAGVTRIESAARMGIKFEIPQKVTPSVQADIDRVKTFMLCCAFDEKKCGAGLAALKAYKRKYNASTRTYSDNPAHDWSSHGADAFRTLAMNHKFDDDRYDFKNNAPDVNYALAYA